MAEVHLSPKLLSDPAWVVTCSKWAMNLINKHLDTVWYIGTGHDESYYSLVETNSGQLRILSPYSTLSGCSSQQSPHEYH